MDILLIGMAGGSGSGKSTITRRLAELFPDAVTVVNHDDYYKAQDDLSMEERAKTNYDHPDAFDTDLLIYHLKQLKLGRKIQCPQYDYTVHNRSDAVREIAPSPVIIVDGILIFENAELRNLFDIRFYVDTDADERVLRRIRRDTMERGRSLESVINQYLTTVKPMHDAFVEPSKKYANIIIPEGGNNVVALEIIENKIRQHLAQSQD
ncbi:MAG: uridine kinase [Clostridia bacterium]|nr:uridine kinase [Clostridia bacterium]